VKQSSTASARSSVADAAIWPAPSPRPMFTVSVTDSEVKRNSSATRDLDQVGDHRVLVAEPEVIGV
jgi:hypothetical protein